MAEPKVPKQEPQAKKAVHEVSAAKAGPAKPLTPAQAKAALTDAQTTQIKQLAADSGVPIVGVTETMPPAYQHLQDWQLAQARDLLAALQKSGR